MPFFSFGLSFYLLIMVKVMTKGVIPAIHQPSKTEPLRENSKILFPTKE
jgi:hypothetical protein